MAELKKYALLLSFVVVLLIAKFLVVPIIEWQNAMVAEIRLFEKKQHKISSVLKNNAYNKQLNKDLNAELEKINQLFYPFQTDAAFKLAQQKEIEALLAKHKLILENIGWKVSSVFAAVSVIQYPVKIAINGKSTDIINFIGELDKYEKYIEVVNFNLSFQGQNNQQLGRLTGNLSLNLFANQLPAEQVHKQTNMARSGE